MRYLTAIPSSENRNRLLRRQLSESATSKFLQGRGWGNLADSYLVCNFRRDESHGYLLAVLVSRAFFNEKSGRLHCQYSHLDLMFSCVCEATTVEFASDPRRTESEHWIWRLGDEYWECCGGEESEEVDVDEEIHIFFPYQVPRYESFDVVS